MSNKLNKSIKNAQVAFVFYFITLLISFVSRKIFIETLGTELVGLSATMQNILGFLNLAELGIYTAVSYALYKPLVDDDQKEINRIVSLFGYFYRWVGLFILLTGTIVSFFLPVFFGKSDLDWKYLYGSYFTFLCVTLFSYFNNYRQVLLAADQKVYIVTRVTNSMNIVKVLIQIVYLRYFDGHYMGWLLTEFVFGFLNRWWTNRRVMKEYPWLDVNVKSGKQLWRSYPQIIVRVKQLFAHKIAEFVLLQTDQILIYAFTSLTTVTMFTNYTMIVQRIARLITSTLGSNLAAVGHLVAEDNREKTQRIFSEFNALFFFVAGVIVYSLYYLTEPFISIWLGKEFLLPKVVFVLLLFNAYVLIVRQTVQFFINGYGLYRDVWAAWAEAGINLFVSLVGGYYWGLPGVVVGTSISTLLIVCLWKPYFLFKEGFKRSVLFYWKETGFYFLLFVVTVIATLPVHWLFAVPQEYGAWISYGVVIFSIFAIIYGLLMYLLTRGFKQTVLRFTNKFRKSN